MLLNLHPESVIAVGVLLPTLASVAMGLRLFSRQHLGVPLKEDDWLLLVSTIFVWGLGITNIAGAALGALGAHSLPAGPNAPHGNTILRGPKDEIAEQVRVHRHTESRAAVDQINCIPVLANLRFLQIVLGYSIVEKITFGVIKISVIMAYRRIFRGRGFNIASLCMMVVCTLLALSFLITSALQCHVRNWNLKYLEWSHRKHCIQAEISWSGYAIADVLTDLVLLLFPVPLVWKLQLTMSKKISVLLVFLLGSLSTAVGIVRMVVILYFTYGAFDFDQTWNLFSPPSPSLPSLSLSVSLSVSLFSRKKSN